MLRLTPGNILDFVGSGNGHPHWCSDSDVPEHDILAKHIVKRVVMGDLLSFYNSFRALSIHAMVYPGGPPG